METTNEALGAKVRALRMKRKMTVRQLGIATGIDAGNLSKLERGLGPAAPRLDTIKTIAKALGVRPGVLVDAA